MFRSLFRRTRFTDKYHSLSFVNTIIDGVLDYNDLRLMLESSDIASAIDVIAPKPIGKYLATIVRVKGKDEHILMESLDDYLRACIGNVIDITPKEYLDGVLFIERMYDILNMTLSYVLSLKGKGTSALFPGGLIYLKIKDLEGKSFIDLLKISGLHTLLERAVLEKASPEEILAKLLDIFKLFKTKMPYIRLKRIYDFIYDYIVVRMAYTLGGEFLRRFQIKPFSIDYASLESIARDRSVSNLVSIISRSYRSLAEIISMLSTIVKHDVLLDYAHILHLMHESRNLIAPYSPDIYVRAIILLRSESTYVKLAILSIIHDWNRDKIREILSRWWVK